MGHPGPLLFRNRGKHLVSHSKVPPHHGSLVLQDGDQQGVSDNVELLVSQVQTVIFRYVTQQVHGSVGREDNRCKDEESFTAIKQINVCTVCVPVQMSNSDDLSSYIVVESVHRAGVDEAVSNPESSLHNLLDLSLDLDIRNTKNM